MLNDIIESCYIKMIFLQIGILDRLGMNREKFTGVFCNGFNYFNPFGVIPACISCCFEKSTCSASDIDDMPLCFIFQITSGFPLKSEHSFAGVINLRSFINPVMLADEIIPNYVLVIDYIIKPGINVNQPADFTLYMTEPVFFKNKLSIVSPTQIAPDI